MRNFLAPSLLALTLALTGCEATGGTGASLDGKKFLETLDGPKVPTVGDTLLTNAQNAEKAGNFPQAQQYYQQLLDKSPENETYLTGYGETLRRMGEHDRAIGFYNRALKVNPSSAAALEGRGLAEMAKGSFDDAANTLAAVQKIDSKRWRTLNALGILFTMKNMHSEARQYFNEALAHSENNPSVLNNVGLSRALDRDFAGAVQMLEKEAASTGSNKAERQRVDMNLALVYAVSGDLTAARTVASQHFSGPTLDNNMGIYAHLANDDQLAKTYLNMALTESKRYYPRAWENLNSLNAEAVAPGSGKAKRVMVTAPVLPAPTQLFAAPTAVPAPTPMKIAEPVVIEEPKAEAKEEAKAESKDETPSLFSTLSAFSQESPAAGTPEPAAAPAAVATAEPPETPAPVETTATAASTEEAKPQPRKIPFAGPTPPPAIPVVDEPAKPAKPEKPKVATAKKVEPKKAEAAPELEAAAKKDDSKAASVPALNDAAPAAGSADKNLDPLLAEKPTTEAPAAEGDKSPAQEGKDAKDKGAVSNFFGSFLKQDPTAQ